MQGMSPLPTARAHVLLSPWGSMQALQSEVACVMITRRGSDDPGGSQWLCRARCVAARPPSSARTRAVRSTSNCAGVVVRPMAIGRLSIFATSRRRRKRPTEILNPLRSDKPRGRTRGCRPRRYMANLGTTRGRASSKTSSQVTTGSRVGIAAARQLSSVVLPAWVQAGRLNALSIFADGFGSAAVARETSAPRRQKPKGRFAAA
jgi:hypothetical protein